jgi:hypothetical protein
MQSTSSNSFFSFHKIKNFPDKFIRFPRLATIVVVMLVALYGFITLFKSEIVDFYTVIFPERHYNADHYWIYLTHFFFNELVLLSLFALGALFVVLKINTRDLIDKIDSGSFLNSRSTIYVIAGAVFLISCYVAVVVLELFPNSADEYAYVFQAEGLSRGKLWDTPHPLKDFFAFEHIAQVNDKWVSRFPPGWPLILSIAFIAGIPPFIVNPLLGALTLIVLYNFCVRHYDRKVAFWATIITALSGSFIFNAASFFSHTSSLLLLLIFIDLMYRYLDEGKVYQILVAGLCLGMLAITRYFTAFLIMIPVGAYLLYHYKWRSIRTMFLMGMSALPPILFFLWYNYAITGNPFLPVTSWAYEDETLGFVKGHSVGKGIEYLLRRIFLFLTWISPGLLILYIVYIAKKIRSTTERLSHPEDYWLIFLAAGYFFYYHFGGNQYGPRFYFEAIPFVVILVVSKVLRGKSRWGYALLFTGLVYSVIKLPIISVQEHEVVVERKDVYTKVEQKGIHNAVVILHSGTGLMRRMSNKELARNDKQYKDDVIYAVNQKERNIQLMEYYKDRDFYLYVRDEDDETGMLIEVNKPAGKLISGN